MGKRGGVKGARNQNEIFEERKRREAFEKLSAQTPMGAFTDDPSAQSYDLNGRVTSGSSQNSLYRNMWDLGQFPPNE